jgi:segregation and condensation protein B
LHSVKQDLEAVLFAAGRPLGLAELAAAAGQAAVADPEAVRNALSGLEHEFPVDGGRGFELAKVAEGWVLRTNRLCEEALSRLFDLTDSERLSPAALETLAIVAYLQPVSRRDVAEIRGVNSESTVQTLLDRDLIRESGRSDQPGSAILYGTTTRFQLLYGLNGVEELPDLEGMRATPATREELRRRLFAAGAPE